jgi:hypothetical protein
LLNITNIAIESFFPTFLIILGQIMVAQIMVALLLQNEQVSINFTKNSRKINFFSNKQKKINLFIKI